MMVHPNLQSKVQEEIEKVIGRERLPCIEDRVNMPFTEAVLMEALRRSSVVHVGVPHRATEEFTVRGYTIPKGVHIISALFSVHHDPVNFPEPHLFKPERFLNEDGTKVVTSEFLIPFGLGKYNATMQCGDHYLRKYMRLIMGFE